ncbi:sulfatase [Radiobacillus sp. PE A8.2]|uniref:sulfatase family protein n=1 Tax=Radiobacillus sp. PE A8.2 TaxID=3380349 RepID=UPI00388DFD7E
MEDKRPNILWICTDQQRFDTIHSLNNPSINTPNIDSLVEEGVAFNRAYSQCTVCSPSRASFLTGRYPRTTRVTKNGAPYFPEDEVLITKLLADTGYDCGLIGKLHLSGISGRIEPRNDDGYRLFKWSPAQRDAWPIGHDYQVWLKEQGVDWNTQNKGRDGGLEAKYHQTTWCTEESEKFIRHNSQEPWLLSVNVYDPHEPFDPPQEYKERYRAEDMPLPKWMEGELDNKPKIQQEDYAHGGQGGVGPICSDMTDLEKKQYVADYYAMIELIDDNVGKLLNVLEETGQRENTVILFMSDHGEMLGDHGLILKGAHFYEGLVHVPLIFSWPGHFKRNLQSNALVELVDIAPTLLDLVGEEIPYYMQGKSLLPILNGQSNPDVHKDHVYCEYYYALKGSHDNIYATMYYDGRYKLVVYHGEELGEFYDHETDPDEYINLWDRKDLMEKKLELMKRNFDSSILTVDPKPPLIMRA